MFYSGMYQDAINTGRLFLAALPGADTSARIHRLAQVLRQAHRFSGKLIEPECLHVSLFFLGEFEEQFVRIVCDAAAELRAEPFEVCFDRSASFQGRPGNRPFVLIGGNGLEQLKSFRQTLGVVLARKGLKRMAKREFTPHITLLYADRKVEEYPVEPIRWTVNEFVLVHSLRGHRHLERWPLRSSEQATSLVSLGEAYAQDSTP